MKRLLSVSITGWWEECFYKVSYRVEFLWLIVACLTARRTHQFVPVCRRDRNRKKGQCYKWVGLICCMQEDCRMRFYVNDKIENQFEYLLEIIRHFRPIWIVTIYIFVWYRLYKNIVRKIVTIQIKLAYRKFMKV